MRYTGASSTCSLQWCSGGRGSVIGCLLGVLLVAVTQNGLNLLGISPYAFKMVVGAIILVAISTSNFEFVHGKPRRVRT